MGCANHCTNHQRDECFVGHQKIRSQLIKLRVLYSNILLDKSISAGDTPSNSLISLKNRGHLIFGKYYMGIFDFSKTILPKTIFLNTLFWPQYLMTKNGRVQTYLFSELTFSVVISPRYLVVARISIWRSLKKFHIDYLASSTYSPLQNSLVFGSFISRNRPSGTVRTTKILIIHTVIILIMILWLLKPTYHTHLPISAESPFLHNKAIAR